MATVTASTGSPRFEPSPRLLTIADVAVMPAQLPSGPIDYELDNGRLVLMSPTGRRHGQIHSAIAAALYTQGQQRGLGEAYVETGVVLWRNPDRMVGPDASFVMSRSLPARESSEGFLETIPELVVEVRSKNDAAAEIDDKVVDYLKAGVRIVWIVEPANELVVEHRVDRPAKMLGKADILKCEDVIPGFHLALADLFQQ
jgi:Uma2 family endonuclease